MGKNDNNDFASQGTFMEKKDGADNDIISQGTQLNKGGAPSELMS